MVFCRFKEGNSNPKIDINGDNVSIIDRALQFSEGTTIEIEWVLYSKGPALNCSPGSVAVEIHKWSHSPTVQLMCYECVNECVTSFVMRKIPLVKLPIR